MALSAVHAHPMPATAAESEFWRNHSRVSERVRALQEAVDRLNGLNALDAKLSSREGGLASASTTTTTTRETSSIVVRGEVERLASDLKSMQAEVENLRRKERDYQARSREHDKEKEELQGELRHFIRERDQKFGEYQHRISQLELSSGEHERALRLQQELDALHTQYNRWQQEQRVKDDDFLRQIRERNALVMQQQRTIEDLQHELQQLRAANALQLQTAAEAHVLRRGQGYELPYSSHVRMGLGWKTQCDLDASVVMLDVDGIYYDHVYFGKKTSKDTAVRHWGDNLTGGGATEDDEIIDVALQEVSPNVVFLFFVVTVYTEGQSFSEVEGAHCRLLDVSRDMTNKGSLQSSQPASVQGVPMASFGLTEFAQGTAQVFVCLYRDPHRLGFWRLHAMGEGTTGRSVRQVEGRCTELARKLLDMNKENLAQFTQWIRDQTDAQLGNLRRSGTAVLKRWGDPFLIPFQVASVRMGLGWDTKCDLDASVIMLDVEGKYYDHVYFGKKTSKDESVIHHGDNMTGEGVGDDEVIDVSLSKVNPNVVFLFFVVTIYTEGQTFKEVEGAYSRLLDITDWPQDALKKSPSPRRQNLTAAEVGLPLARFDLNDTKTQDSTAKVFACLYRDPQRLGCWKMQAIGESSPGRSVRDVEDPCIKFAHRLIEKEQANTNPASPLGVVGWGAMQAWIASESKYEAVTTISTIRTSTSSSSLSVGGSPRVSASSSSSFLTPTRSG